MTRSRKFVGLAALSAVSLTLSGCGIGGEDEAQEEPQAEVEKFALPDVPIASADGDSDTQNLKVTQGLIYVVDLVSSGNKIEIGFSHTYRTSYSGKKFAAHQLDFEEAMKAANGIVSLPSGWTRKDKLKKCKNKGQPTRKCPKADTDLSVSNNKISFIGFVLEKKSAQVRNKEKITWRFVEERTDTEDQYQDDHIIKRHNKSPEKYYTYLRKMDKDGKFKDAFCPYLRCTNGPYEQSNVVGGYFVANGVAAYEAAEAKNSSYPEYQHRFNLYTEIHSTDDTETNIPVIIDPDVRWPGGDGP